MIQTIRLLSELPPSLPALLELKMVDGCQDICSGDPVPVGGGNGAHKRMGMLSGKEERVCEFVCSYMEGTEGREVAAG